MAQTGPQGTHAPAQRANMCALKQGGAQFAVLCAAGAGAPLYEERGVGVWVWGGVVGAQFSWCLGGACIPIAPHPDTLAHALQEYKGRLCWGKLWYCGTVVQLP